MRLVSYNIQYGVGRDGRLDLDRIADSVAGGDIIALQEVTRGSPRNGRIDMVAELGRRLPDYFHVFGSGLDVGIGGRDPDGQPNNDRFHFGNMLLSRWPIISARNLLLPRTLRFERFNPQRSALEGLVDTPLGPLRFYSIHLDHAFEDERMRQIAFLKERVAAYVGEGGGFSAPQPYGFPEPPRPEDFVLLGDFNMRPDSAAYTLMSDGEGDPIDVSRLAGVSPSAVHAMSWIDNDDPAKTARFDYIFVSGGLVARLRRTWINSEAEGSDHLPVWLEMK